jgi:monovalent cation/hydrogen antiporter
VRLIWHMSFNAVVRWHHRRVGFNPPRPMLRPSIGSGLVISWAGMRGILSLAAALALPAEFPFRGLIVFTAFAVVLGTLVIQGLTLKPLLRALNLHDDDPVGKEVIAARARGLLAGLAVLESKTSPQANAVRHEFSAHFTFENGSEPEDTERSSHSQMFREALRAAREAVLAMRDNAEIGDAAFHQMEEELDRLEMAEGLTE